MRLLLLITMFSSAAAYGQEAGVVFSATLLKEIGSRDVGVGTEAAGIGGRFVYRAFPHLDFESELIIWPNNPATAGTWVQGLFGAKIGERFDHWGAFAKVRPGFMHFTKDPFGASAPGGTSLLGRHFLSATEPSLDVGGVVEYYTQRGLILRFDLGDTILRYGRRSVFVSQLTPPLEAGGFTTHNWQGSFGLGFRF